MYYRILNFLLDLFGSLLASFMLFCFLSPSLGRKKTKSVRGLWSSLSVKGQQVSHQK